MHSRQSLSQERKIPQPQPEFPLSSLSSSLYKGTRNLIFSINDQRFHGGESIHDVIIDDEPGRILFLLVLFLCLPHGPIYRLAHPLAACRCKAPRSSRKEILSSSIYLDRNTCCSLHLHSDTMKNHRLRMYNINNPIRQPTTSVVDVRIYILPVDFQPSTVTAISYAMI